MPATKQLYVYLSVSIRPSVCHTFHCVNFSRVWNFLELLITEVMSMQGQGQRSDVKVTDIKTQFIRFRTITPVWIHTKLEVAKKRCPNVCHGHSSNFKVSRDKKSQMPTQIGGFWTVTPVWIHQWLSNVAQSLTYHRRRTLLFFPKSFIKC